MTRLWIPLVVLALTLGISVRADAAPKKVDWSSYIEDPSDRKPLVSERPSEKTSAKKRTATAKASKAKKSKAKAKAKRSAKKRRR